MVQPASLYFVSVESISDTSRKHLTLFKQEADLPSYYDNEHTGTQVARENFERGQGSHSSGRSILQKTWFLKKYLK